MELGKFKRYDFDEEDKLPDWLREDSPAAEKPEQLRQPPAHPSKLSFPPSQRSEVKPTDDFMPSQVKSAPKHVVQPIQKNDEVPTISIQVHMPSFHMPHVSIPWRKLRPWLISGAAIAVLLVGGKVLQTSLSNNKPATQKAPVVPAAELGYKPLVPPVNAATEAAKPPAATYDEQRHFYTFDDIYKGANLTVNQQAVPEKLNNSQTEVKKLATNIGATDTFTTTLGTVYIGTSKESGTQRLMLVNTKMLMFIQSTKVLQNADWVTYVQSLQ